MGIVFCILALTCIKTIKMIRYKGFDGFFLMKKDASGTWEYMSKFHRRGGKANFSFSSSEVRYFSDNTIKDETAWKVFDMMKAQYPDSKIVLYVSIDKKISRVKFYNPEADNKITAWLRPSDFSCFVPQKDLK